MVQVWAMVRSGSTAVLYIPSEEKSCMIKMLYHAEIMPKDGYTELMITMPEEAFYQDGALAYQVCGALPIPIPGDCMGKRICIRTSAGEQVSVIVQESYKKQYQAW